MSQASAGMDATASKSVAVLTRGNESSDINMFAE
jgi:hypothetical protein